MSQRTETLIGGNFPETIDLAGFQKVWKLVASIATIYIEILSATLLIYIIEREWGATS